MAQVNRSGRVALVTGAARGETPEQFSQLIALGRLESPEDVASFVSYLASRIRTTRPAGP